MRQSSGDADHSVSAHSQIASVVKEDNASRARRIAWLKQQCSYQYVGTAGLAENGAPVEIVFTSKSLNPIRKRSGAEMRTTGQHAAGGFPRGV
jgi:hypothetical protein